MEDQVEKFDPSKLMEGVKDRIKATFVSLIPDDAWNNMVEKELYIFTTGKIIPHHEYKGADKNGNPIYLDWEERKPYTQEHIKDSYNQPGYDDISPLQKMIRNMLENRFYKDLEKYLNSEEYQGLWKEYGEREASAAIEEIMVKNASTIFRNMLAGFMQTGFDIMRSNIQNTIGNDYRHY